ncbi:glycoside hydrolase family 43 protein [Epithele typhae]|uniref:glycoside hydrolase family 43 protein n=1 Tax=Epithele typhae TaxID=378194 RepID=UPI00200749B8|nr:glycoside hydrolase family 43 protein [Epithele typhae]KAH9915771.1 glycoside hydrolase family 43 protein [Epithele typhae]
MKFFSLASVSTLASIAFATPNPLPGSANITLRDPAVIYNNASQTYFVFSTGKNIKIYTSPSLKGPWSSAGEVLTNGSMIPVPSNAGAWAPDVSRVNDEFVLYYAVSTGGRRNSTIGVTTSPNMESGSWTDHGKVIQTKESDTFNAIDANLIDADGLKLLFGSYGDGIFQLQMSDISTTLTPLPGNHLAGGDKMPDEGGFTYKPKNSSFFYTFFSNGVTPLQGATERPPPGQEYKVLVGRSENVAGPYVDKSGLNLTSPPAGTLVLGSHDTVYAPGGQSVYLDPVSGRDIMVYHYVMNDSFGGPSYLGVNFLDFSSGWPEVVEE